MIYHPISELQRLREIVLLLHAQSRASAAALITVLGPIDDLAFRYDYEFSGTRRTKTPLPINMKFSYLIMSVKLPNAPKNVRFG
jgi:hypothetical protein